MMHLEVHTSTLNIAFSVRFTGTPLNIDLHCGLAGIFFFQDRKSSRKTVGGIGPM